MAKKKKRRQLQSGPQAPQWQWFTFPVLASFTAGGLVILLLQFLLGPLFIVAFYVWLGLAWFVLTHLVMQLTRFWILCRRAARLGQESARPAGRPRPLPPV